MQLLSFKFFSNFLAFLVKVAQPCPTLCNPMDCSPSGSSIHGLLQARILEWVVIPFSRGSSWSRDWTRVSCIAGRFFTVWATREALGPHSNSQTSFMGHPEKCCPPVHYVFWAGTWYTALVFVPQAFVPSACHMLAPSLWAAPPGSAAAWSSALLPWPPQLGWFPLLWVLAWVSLWEVNDAILAAVLSGTPTGLWIDTRQGLHCSLCVWGRAVACMQVCVLQSCPTLLRPYGCSLLQARILEWVAMPSSRGFSQPGSRWILYPLSHLEGLSLYRRSCLIYISWINERSIIINNNNNMHIRLLLP